MTLLSPLDLQENQSGPISPAEYKQNVRRATELLVHLGIMDTESTDIKESVQVVLNKLKRDEVILYGKELT